MLQEELYLMSQNSAVGRRPYARDRHAAERLVKRSGQMAVPQIDIDGHLIVGFDREKIDRIIGS